MSSVKKIIQACGLALVLAFGTFAVGLAQDLPTSGLQQSLRFHKGFDKGPAQIDSYTLSLGMNSETGDLSNSLSPETHFHRVSCAQHFEPQQLSIAKRPHTAKVSIQLLELVLLI